MFGSNNGASAGAPDNSNSNRPTAESVARIDANLTQVIVAPGTGADAGVQVFVNGQPIAPGSLENVGIEISAPTDAAPDGTLTAILSRYAGGSSASGGTVPTSASPSQTTTALFPGTVEIIARGRRVVVSCPVAGSFDGLFLGLGLRQDGTSTELTGVQSLRVVISPDLCDAKIVWVEDGRDESLLG